MNNLINKIKFKLSIKKRDTYIGLVSENGTGRIRSLNKCTLNFSLVAYKKNDSDIVMDEISISKKIRSIDDKSDNIVPLSIIKFTANSVIEYGYNKIYLKKIINNKYKDNDLEKILKKRKEPVIYISNDLGEFILDRRLDWYEGKVKWNNSDIVLLFAGDLNKLKQTESNAISILKDQQKLDEYVKREICKELLTLKNENWLDEGEKVISEEEFISKIFLDSIIVNESDDYVMNYSDGNIFWGHCITVETNLHGKVDYIGLQG